MKQLKNLKIKQDGNKFKRLRFLELLDKYFLTVFIIAIIIVTIVLGVIK